MADTNILNQRSFDKELHFKTSRSSGPGGQNVNKVNSRVELRFHVESSNILNEEEKLLIQTRLKNRINNEGELVLFSEISRSQIKNKQDVIERFYELIEQALKPRKKRIKTKPSIASQVRRLENKKMTSQKKENRRKPDY